MPRLLLVSQRPIDLHGGASVRWRYLLETLPELGWEVDTAFGSGDPGGAASVLARTRSRRARNALRAGAGVAWRVLRPLGLNPGLLAHDPLWAVRGRRPIAEAIARRRPDVVWVTCPPHPAMFAAAAAAERAGLPFVLELRDLWAGDPGLDAGRPLLRRLQARAVARAARVVCMTPEAAARLAELHPEASDRIAVLPNGFQPELLELRGAPRPPRGDRAVLAHAGTLYGRRSIDGLVDALARPELRDRVRLVLVGGINDRSAAKLEAAGDAVDVDVRPPTSWREAVEAMRTADVAVVLFTPGDETAVPGKLYEALALGVPVLALTGPDSALRRLLERLGADDGVALHDDPPAIAAAIERLLADPPAPLAPEQLAPFDRRRVAADVAALLDELCH
jgi:glycosyltransferase involved in cell wall biosynthesis